MSKLSILMRPALALVILLAFSELSAFICLTYTPVRSSFYLPPSADSGAKHLKDRHSILGWPTPEREKMPRKSPASDLNSGKKPKVALFGDSFTYGEEVGDGEAWGNQLSLMMDTEVCNFGVGGYGTDQALLRFECRYERDFNLVILGILTENVIRNINQYRNLIAGTNQVGLKPRFRLDGDTLALVEIPHIDPSNIASFLGDPAPYLQWEFFLDNGSPYCGQPQFPYSISLVRAFNHWSTGARLKGLPAHADFLDPSHPSDAVEITARIAARFHRVAADRGFKSAVLILPTCKEIEYYLGSGKWLHSELGDRVARSGETWDVSIRLASGGVDPAKYYVTRSSHMNGLGNRAVAEFVAAKIGHRWPDLMVIKK